MSFVILVMVLLVLQCAIDYHDVQNTCILCDLYLYISGKWY